MSLRKRGRITTRDPLEQPHGMGQIFNPDAEGVLPVTKSRGKTDKKPVRMGGLTPKRRI